MSDLQSGVDASVCQRPCRDSADLVISFLVLADPTGLLVCGVYQPMKNLHTLISIHVYFFGLLFSAVSPIQAYVLLEAVHINSLRKPF